MSQVSTELTARTAHSLLPGRDLDGLIAEHVKGWTLVHTGKDARGENDSEILAAGGKIPEGVELPNLGKIHRAYLAPQWSKDLPLALQLLREHSKYPGLHWNDSGCYWYIRLNDWDDENPDADGLAGTEENEPHDDASMISLAICRAVLSDALKRKGL
jgi:hypothetical protein